MDQPVVWRNLALALESSEDKVEYEIRKDLEGKRKQR
jgi:hypothetical protein